MSAIYDMPLDPPTEAGLGFNYAVWTPGTIATFTNVRWNNDYRDFPIFPDGQDGLNAHIDNQQNSNVTIDGMSYARPGNPIRINIPLSRMMWYNYVRVFNPAQPVPGDDQPRYWYYFVTDVQHIAPNTTQITVQLDVIQSFIYHGVRFGRCYVEAGHVGVANYGQFDDYGRKFLTVPEGFDLGGEYQIKQMYRQNDGAVKAGPDSNGRNYQIIIMSSTKLLSPSDAGTAENPELVTASGSLAGGLPNGAALYTCADYMDFYLYLANMHNKPWVTQGIMGVWAFPGEFPIPVVGLEVAPGIRRIAHDPATPKRRQMAVNWRDEQWAMPKQRYRHLKKFLTYPYSFWELTTYTGQPVVIKPEGWNTPDADVVALPHHVPPNPRVTYYPWNYNNVNGNNTSYGGVPDGGEFLDMASSISNLPTFSVVNNGYMSFLASNSNSIAFQHSSADWSQQKALYGADTSYKQATSAIDAMNNINAIQTSTNLESMRVNNDATRWNTGTSMIGGIVRGGFSGGLHGAAGASLGALETGAHALINMDAATKSTAIQNNALTRTNQKQVNNAAFARDTNQDYARMAAVGDYFNSLSAINAKVQDAKMIQPTVSGQLGGDANLLANYMFGYTVKFKQVDENVATIIGEHWLRYGYRCNRYYNFHLKEDKGSYMGLHVMSKFSYWKLMDVTILEGRMPEGFKQTIRGIFEKGATVWRNPLEIGRDFGEQNEPLEGVYF